MLRCCMSFCSSLPSEPRNSSVLRLVIGENHLAQLQNRGRGTKIITTDGVDERPSAITEATTCVRILSFLVEDIGRSLSLVLVLGSELKIPNHIW